MSGATQFGNIQAINRRTTTCCKQLATFATNVNYACTITAESSMPFATPKRYGKIAVGLCDKCRGSFQATCRHLYNVNNACTLTAGRFLPFATSKRYSKIAVGLRRNFRAKKYLLTVQKLATLQIKLRSV